MKSSKSKSVVAQNQFRRAAVAAVLAACGSASVVEAQIQYVGATSASGSAPTNLWGLGSNWAGGVAPNGVDVVAGFAQGVATEVEVDGNYTVGGLVFNNPAEVAANFTFPTKPTSFDPLKGLTFSVTSGTPVIETHPGATAFYFNTISGTQGIEKKGRGKFTFRFNPIDQPYTGDVRISGGVFGIQKDRSLGDVNNDIFIGAIDGSGTLAILTSEPSDNSVTSIAATRDIFLTGSGGALSSLANANDQRNRLLVNGIVSDGVDSFGPTVTQGYVALLGNNTYDGTTTVSGGALVAAGPSALPGWNVAGRVATAGSVIGRVGGAGEFTVSDIDSMKTTVSFTATTAALGIDTTNATGPVDWAGLTAGEAYSIAKSGPGTLRITGANNYTGTRARIYEGTLALASGASLPTNITAIFFRTPDNSPVTLDLGGNTQQITAVSAAAGGTSVVTNGTLTVKNTGANFDVNNVNTNTIVDLRGLSSFTFDSSTGSGTTADAGTRALRVIPATAGTAVVNELYLSAGSNLAKVNAVQIGAATGTSQGNGHEGRLFLGTSNEFRVSGASGAFTVGGFNGSGRVAFQTGLTDPSLKIRSTDGAAALPLLRIGETSSGVRNGGGNLDLAGGLADIVATDVQLGRHIAGSDNPDTSSMTIAGGNVTATRITMAEKVSGGNTTNGLHPQLNSTINLTGGVISAGSVAMGKATNGTGTVNFTPGPSIYRPTINISGGTFAATTIAPASAGSFSESASIRTLNLTGGTLRPLDSTTDLTVSGVAALDADPATTGNMILVRVPSGLPTIHADADRKVTFTDTTMLGGSAGTTSTVGTLVKSGPGGLQINGAINNDLPIKVDAGAAQVSNGATPTRADVNATFIVDYTGASPLAQVVTNIAAGFNGGAWDGATGYISSSAAASTSPKGALGYAEASTLYGPGPTTVNGLTVDDSAVVVKYTLAGNANLDNIVNISDFSILAANFNLPSGWGTGDFNYDGVTNISDFSLLAANFNQVVPASLPRGGAVPEPASALVLAFAGLMSRRRRH